MLVLAEQLFAERGYDQASMDELARRAGISKPVVYDLVGTKDEVFRTCMTRVGDELRERVRAAVAAMPTDPLGRLRAGSHAFFQFVADHRATWDVLLSGEGGPVNAEISAIRQRQAALVALLLAQTQHEMGIDVHPDDTQALAWAINGALEALAAWWAEHRDRTADDLANLSTRLIAPGLLAVADELRGAEPGHRI